MAVPCRVVFGVEGDSPGMYGPSACPTPPDKSVVLETLGQYFPPWMVTRAALNAVLRPGMSGIATDVILFHQHDGRLVHRYHLYADSLPHMSLRGRVMKTLTRFTIQASVVARLTILKDQILRSTWADSKLDQRVHRAPDSASPARKAKHTTAHVTFAADVEVIASTSGRSSAIEEPASLD